MYTHIVVEASKGAVSILAVGILECVSPCLSLRESNGQNGDGSFGSFNDDMERDMYLHSW